MNRSDFLKRSVLGLGVVAALPLLSLVPGVPKGSNPAMLWPGDAPFIEMMRAQQEWEHKRGLERAFLSNPHWDKKQTKILEERYAGKT